MNISGAMAVVTGASSGIGTATARALAAEGARVSLLARDRERLDAIAAAIRARHGQADTYQVDLGDARAVTSVTKTNLARVGPPHILVDNAGAGRWLSVAEIDPDELQQAMALPYSPLSTSLVNCCRR